MRSTEKREIVVVFYLGSIRLKQTYVSASSETQLTLTLRHSLLWVSGEVDTYQSA